MSISSRRRRLSAWGMFAAFAATWLSLAGVAQADDLRQSTSLRLVPADAAMYRTSLRNAEIFQAFMRSKAARRFIELPFYKAVRKQMAQPLTQFQEALKDPANRELYELALEMVSDEVFIYGGSQWADVGRLMQELNGARQMGQIMTALGEMGMGPGAGDAQREQARALLETLVDNVDSLKVPDTVIGFKIESKEAARSQLARLEGLLTVALAGLEEPRPQLKKVKIGEERFLTLQADGSMIPWDDIPWEKIEDEEGEFDVLVEKLKTVKAVVCVGIFDDYLLVSVGDSTQHLKQLGKGDLLADREEFAPLWKFADRPIVGISYASKELVASTNLNADDLNSLLQLAEDLTPGVDDKDLERRLRADLRELEADMHAGLGNYGAMLDFRFVTDNGFEGYNYAWSDYSEFDGSQPLTLLDHVGGNPILFAVARAADSEGDYDLLVKWLRRMYEYFEEMAVSDLDDDERKQYDEFKAQALPLLQRLDRANRKQLGPALKDGQLGFVIDARTTSRQWQRDMPVADTPLPMLELALVLGVSDAKRLQKGVATYFDVTNKFLKMLHEMEPDEFPDMKVPPPESRDVGVGTEFFFALPADWGMDSEFAPNAGLSDRVAVLGLTHQHTRRLLTATPLAVNSPPLADRERPLAAAVSFNFAALVYAVEPWVDYGFDQAMQDWDPAEDSFPLPTVRDQVKAVMEILRCFRGYSSASYFEEKALVTHSEWNFVDLE